MPDIEKDVADLNALTREAHETIKDLNGLLKKAEQMQTYMTTLGKAYAGTISTLYERAWEDVETTLKTALNTEVTKMIEEIGDLLRIMEDTIYEKFYNMSPDKDTETLEQFIESAKRRTTTGGT